MTLILSGTDGLSDVDGSAATPAIRGTDANTGIFFPAADTIAFSEGGVEAVRIDSSGNVGIGTTPSAWGSSVKAVQLPWGCAIFNIGAGDVAVTQNAYFDNPNFKYASTTGVGSSAYRQIDGTHRWSYAASGTAGNNITFSEAMRIDSSGNVGIGTSSPGEKLDVQGSSSPTIKVRNTSAVVNNYSQLYLDTNNTFSGTGASFVRSISLNAGNSSTALAFGTNADGGGAPTERMRIDSSGNLLVGITSAGYNYFVKTNPAQYVLGAQNPSATTPYGLLLNFSGVTNNSSAYFLVCSDVGGNRLLVAGNGTVSNSTGTYNTISDVRLKENIVDATSKLDKLMQLKVRNYNLIGDDLKQIGFIAQEIEQVFPSLVVESTYPGEDVPTKEVKTSVLIPVLIKALQEQQAIITQLQADVAALKGTA